MYSFREIRLNNNTKRWHSKMETIGFYRRVNTQNGQYALPHATYVSDRYANADLAANAAFDAAKQVALGAQVLTSGSD